MGGKTRIKSQTMQFAMLKIQCTIHSGLRMPGYQSADVYLWSEDPGSHKHDPSNLEARGSSALEADAGMKPTVCLF